MRLCSQFEEHRRSNEHGDVLNILTYVDGLDSGKWTYELLEARNYVEGSRGLLILIRCLPTVLKIWRNCSEGGIPRQHQPSPTRNE